MKISELVWIDKKIKWNILRKRELMKFNRYKGHAYIVCTSPHQHLLFEVVEARFLNPYYNEATVLAICYDRKDAVHQVTCWIDRIYNQKEIAYTQL